MYKALDQSIRDSEKLAEVSDFAYRVWNQGLATSDMAGRIPAAPKRFWAHAMPLVEYDEQRILAAIQELAAKRLVHLYEADGKRYMVYHEHEDHNKGMKNLRNVHPACPPPPQNLCYCVTYAAGEEAASADATAVPTAEPSTGVPLSLLFSPVHVPVPVPAQEGVQGEKRPPIEADSWVFSMVKVLKSRGCPNKDETIRTWVNTISGRLGRQRSEELFRFGNVANMPVTEIYDNNCKEVKGGNGKQQQAPGARSTGAFSLAPGELEKRISGGAG